MIQTEHKLFGYPFSRRSSTTNTRCWTQSFRGHLLHHCAIGDASKLDWHIIWLALFLLQLWFLLFYLLGHLSSLDKTVLVELLTWAGIRHICCALSSSARPTPSHATPPPPIKYIHKQTNKNPHCTGIRIPVKTCSGLLLQSAVVCSGKPH